MPRYTQREIEALVCERFGEGPADYVEGAARIGGWDVWRVWTVDDDDDFNAHYAAAGARSTAPEIFENFVPFADWLNRELDLRGRTDRGISNLPVIVASVVVVAGMALVAFVVVRDPQSLPIGSVLTAIVGGAAGFLFARGVGGRRAKTGKTDTP